MGMAKEISKPLDPVPSLKAVVEEAGLKLEHLTVALPMHGEKKPFIENRNSIVVDDGTNTCIWMAPGLRELFRGNVTPPSLEQYPPEYVPCFFYYEQHFLTACEALGDRTDQEMEEVYAMLRRRPDGKSLGVLHDFVWQVSALLLGTHILSGAEFEAVVGRLERSARTWALRPVSRNYIAAVKEMFGGS
jgi:hypothetical protein